MSKQNLGYAALYFFFISVIITTFIYLNWVIALMFAIALASDNMSANKAQAS